MIYVEAFKCTPNEVRLGDSDIELRFKANGQNNLLTTPVRIVYTFTFVPTGATAIWVHTQKGRIQNGGTELVVDENFPDYLAGFKYKATIQLANFDEGNGIEILMTAKDLIDEDIEEDSTFIQIT